MSELSTLAYVKYIQFWLLLPVIKKGLVRKKKGLMHKTFLSDAQVDKKRYEAVQLLNNCDTTKHVPQLTEDIVSNILRCIYCT